MEMTGRGREAGRKAGGFSALAAACGRVYRPRPATSGRSPFLPAVSESRRFPRPAMHLPQPLTGHAIKSYQVQPAII